MAFEVVWTEDARDDLFTILDYLNKEWSNKIAAEFYTECLIKIERLKVFPKIGSASNRKPSVRRILITKHNALYYRIEQNSILLLSIFDIRKNPKSNPYQ